MARISKSELTKLEIIRVATRMFLEYGYTTTTIKSICDELSMSAGNLTFYFHSKEHLLATLVEMCCDFQWKMMKEELKANSSPLEALCLELMAMMAICEENEVAKDFYISAYTSPMSLDIIRRSDAVRAKTVFGEYCPHFDDEDFAAAEVIVSGVEYASMMTTEFGVHLDKRIRATLDTVMAVYGVPSDIRKSTIDEILKADYRKVGRKVLDEFRTYVEEVNEQAFLDLIKV